MPVNARNLNKSEAPTNNISSVGAGTVASISDLNGAQSEDEKIKALFDLQETQWKEQQEGMAK